MSKMVRRTTQKKAVGKNSPVIPETIEYKLQCEAFNNFRCKMAADSLDIDVKKKSVHHVKIEKIKVPEQWNVGLVYGNSGSGKTSLVKHLFGEDVFKTILKEDEPIINQFPEDFTYEQCAELSMAEKWNGREVSERAAQRHFISNTSIKNNHHERES